MKLLGEYYPQNADQYKDLLLAQGIEAELGFPQKPSSYITRQSVPTCIYVPEESYDKAVSIIKDYDEKRVAEIKGNAEKFNSIIPNILIATGAVVLMLLLWIYYKNTGTH